MMRSGLTPNFFSTPASSSISRPPVLGSAFSIVMTGFTSWVRSLSPLAMITRMRWRSACRASVPITSSASTPSISSSGQPIAAMVSLRGPSCATRSSGIDGRFALYSG
ncbi:hypothetical protein D3C83_02280 [compost metagenome]